jgi:HEAT repeat protein
MNIQRLIITLFLLIPFTLSSSVSATDSDLIDELVMAKDIDVTAVKNHGESVMPILSALYSQTNDKLKRAKIAWLFYQLGWKSENAKEAMMQDAHTDDVQLRLQVQWALGRVSSDDRIVNTLLEIMQSDTNPLFREKATCALASDQIHLTSQQRLKLLDGLVDALNDSKLDVRQNAVKALEIQTGQKNNFNPSASASLRLTDVSEWQSWMTEYKKTSAVKK